MQEATGQTGLMNIMLAIIGIIIVLLAGSIAYSKAFRVKNKIIDIVEKYEIYNDDSRREIESTLTNIGYRVIDQKTYNSHCATDKFDGFTLDARVAPGHLYCIYKSNNTSDGTYYYKVVAFMYFDIPVVGGFIEIPVTGETKTFYSQQGEEWKTVK